MALSGTQWHSAAHKRPSEVIRGASALRRNQRSSEVIRGAGALRRNQRSSEVIRGASALTLRASGTTALSVSAELQILATCSGSPCAELISAHQCSSVLIRFWPRAPGVPVRSSSVLISAHQCSSVLISAHQCSSVLINAHQRQSAHLWNRLAAHSNDRNQRQSAHLWNRLAAHSNGRNQRQSAHLWNRLAAHSNGRIFGEGGGHSRLNHTWEGGAPL